MLHPSAGMVYHVLRTSMFVDVMQMYSKALKRQLVFYISPLSHKHIDFGDTD